MRSQAWYINKALLILRALGWLRDAGLGEPTARTFAGDDYAPLLEAI
jgi:hypothetical protein